MNANTNKCQCPGGEYCKKLTNHTGDKCRFNAKDKVNIDKDGEKLPSCTTCKYPKDKIPKEKAEEQVKGPTQPSDSDYYVTTLGMRGIYKLMQDFSNKSIDTAFCPKSYQGTIGRVLQEDTYDVPLDIEEYRVLVYFQQNKPWTSATVDNNTIKVLLKLANYRLNSRSTMEIPQYEDEEPMNLQEENEGPAPTRQENFQETQEIVQEIQEMDMEPDYNQITVDKITEENDPESDESVGKLPSKRTKKPIKSANKKQKSVSKNKNVGSITGADYNSGKRAIQHLVGQGMDEAAAIKQTSQTYVTSSNLTPDIIASTSYGQLPKNTFRCMDNAGGGDCFYYAVVDAICDLAKRDKSFKGHLTNIGIGDILDERFNKVTKNTQKTRMEIFKKHLVNSIVPETIGSEYFLSLLEDDLRKRNSKMRDLQDICYDIIDLIGISDQWGIGNTEASCFLVFKLLQDTHVILYENLDNTGTWYVTAYNVWNMGGLRYRNGTAGSLLEDEIQEKYQESINLFFRRDHYMALIPKNNIR